MIEESCEVAQCIFALPETVSPVHRAATPWRPRRRAEHVENDNSNDLSDSSECSPLHRTGTPWRPKHCANGCQKPEDSTNAFESSEFKELCNHNPTPWKPKPRNGSAMERTSSIESVSTCASIGSSSRTSSVSSTALCNAEERDTQLPAKAIKHIDLFLSCRADMKYAGRLEIIEVEKLDFSFLPDWKNLNERYAEAIRSKQRSRQRTDDKVCSGRIAFGSRCQQRTKPNAKVPMQQCFSNKKIPHSFKDMEHCQRQCPR